METARQTEPVVFDREVTFEEVFTSAEARECSARVSEMVNSRSGNK
jgi:hypothetical protein